MPSSDLKLDKRRRTYVRLIGEIQHALNEALRQESERRNLTVTGMAELLGVDKSFVSRKMSGSSNMTLETLADLAYALDRSIGLVLQSRAPRPGANYASGDTSTSAVSANLTMISPGAATAGGAGAAINFTNLESV
jgi:hypothetical protein